MINKPSGLESTLPGTTGIVPPPAGAKSSAATQRRSDPPAAARDAIALLSADHRKVEILFANFAQVRMGDSVDEKFSVAKQVCGDLLIHMAIEEAIFYPKVRQALSEGNLVDEAEHEHDGAKDLIKELGEIDPGDPLFDSKVEALARQISEHVEKEETVVFPRMLTAPVDLMALGLELFTAKSDMRARLGLPPE